MFINKETEYAIIGLTHLAEQENENPVKIKKIAKTEKLSEEFLRKVFKKLSKEGFIKTSFGPNGGILLKIPAEKISLQAILQLIQGKTFIPCFRENKICQRQRNCTLKKALKEADQYLINFFENKTIKNLIS